MRKIVDLNWALEAYGRKFMTKNRVRQALLNELLNEYFCKYHQYPTMIEEQEDAKFAAGSLANPWWYDEVLQSDADVMLEQVDISKVRLHKNGLCSYEGGDVFDVAPEDNRYHDGSNIEYHHDNGMVWYLDKTAELC